MTKLRTVAVVCCLWATAAGAEEAAVPSFRLEVAPIISKAGCNQGACHGNLNGKGGFRLSLRGDDPSFDLRAMTRDAFGRRLDRQDPENSLLLRKATGAVDHDGGRRFAPTSREFRIVAAWIAAGATDAVGPAVVRLEI
ncbi:MAG: DUF1549 and DUF1553 domain-containing protein, partial [Planctomycetia bacterium]